MQANNTHTHTHIFFTNVTTAECYISKQYLTSALHQRTACSQCLYECMCLWACMCTCHVWISDCERTGCSPCCSSTLISVAVLALGVLWNVPVRHLQLYADVCSFLSSTVGLCVCWVAVSWYPHSLVGGFKRNKLCSLLGIWIWTFHWQSGGCLHTEMVSYMTVRKKVDSGWSCAVVTALLHRATCYTGQQKVFKFIFYCISIKDRSYCGSCLQVP